MDHRPIKVHGEAEVDKDDLVLLVVGHHILRLDVVVDQAAAVHDLQPLHHLKADCNHSVEIELFPLPLKKAFNIHVVLRHHNIVEVSLIHAAVGEKLGKAGPLPRHLLQPAQDRHLILVLPVALLVFGVALFK